jgi:protocatechuate 3,4-dioxygenase, beta subunit
MKKERRNFLIQGLGAAAALVSGAKAVQAACGTTAAQTAGPFIPNDFPFREPREGAPYIAVRDANADLTWVQGRVDPSGRPLIASGQILYLRGRVQDPDCRPVAGANVYLWQADDNGHYNHREDPNVRSAAELDPNFQYRGFVQTDAWGRFMFKTIKPKYYPLDPVSGQLRTAHFHVSVLHPQHQQLTTQTYFEGDLLQDIARIRQLNSNDIILSPRGTILPELRELIVEYRRLNGFNDGLVGDLALTVQRR